MSDSPHPDASDDPATSDSRAAAPDGTYGLRAVDPSPVFDTDENDLVAEFYQPCLKKTVHYQRGVGYFTSSWFEHAAAGLAGLITNGGRAQWLVSPVLEEGDWQAMQDGVDGRRSDRLTEALAAGVDELSTELSADTRETLAWLIADDHIDIRLALPTGDLNDLYHEKVGIMTDAYGQQVSFTGGVNETAAALTHFDSLTVDTSWRGEYDAATVNKHAERFERLWTGASDNLTVYELPQAIEEDIAALRTRDERPYDLPAGDGGLGVGEAVGTSSDGAAGGLAGSAPIELWPPQAEAVRAWVDNDYRGLFAMATGTGKSYAAIAARNAYKESVDSFITVIAVPEKSLAKQWDNELNDWGIDTGVYAFSVNNDWRADVSDAATNVELGLVNPILLTTHNTVASETFRKHIARASAPALLIGDEVHGLGASTYQNALIDAYDARLGLSATHERYMDAAGTQTLCDYFDEVVYEYAIADAIDDEYLVPYEYHPVVVEMTDDEMEEYLDESQRLAATISSDSASEEDIRAIANVRALIAKRAVNKYDALRRVLADLGEPAHTLVYTNSDQIRDVQDILDEAGIRQHKFTQAEGMDQRRKLLDQFARRDLHALVGIECLDEGVDVKPAKTAILMSNSGNERQFIQRRGRVLRQHDTKDKASVYDMVVIPPRGQLADLQQSQQRLLERELDRVEAFATSAQNAAEARGEVRPIRDALEAAQDGS